MELPVDKWVLQLEQIVQYTFEKSRLPQSRNTVYSTCLCGVVTITCLPCITWSVLLRIFACPFQCFSHGPAYMCADNGCTQVTDGCVGVQYNQVYSKKVLPNLPSKNTLTPEERQMLKSRLQVFLDLYIAKKTNGMFFTNAHYLIHDCVCPSLKHFLDITDKTTPHNFVKILSDIILILTAETQK